MLAPGSSLSHDRRIHRRLHCSPAQVVPDQLSRGSIGEPAFQRGRRARRAEGRLPALVQRLSLPGAECAKAAEGRSF